MWICNNCQNQNEENFKFCWSCGIPRSENRKNIREITRETPLQKEIKSAKPEIPKVERLETEVKKVEKKVLENAEISPKETSVIKNEDEILTRDKAQKPIEKENTIQNKSNIKEPEIFSTFSTKHKISEDADNNNVNWQKEIFTIAVRLIGLYFLFQVIFVLPDFLIFVYKFISNGSDFDGNISTYLLTSFPVWFKYLFYFILSIYLISSGRILLWLLPDK
jgi:hypothetical protein